MRKQISAYAWTALFHCVVFVSSAYAAPYPLSNGAMEGAYQQQLDCPNVTGEVAAGWTDNTCWLETAPQIRYERELTAPRSGVAAQKITLVSGEFVQFAQPLPTPLKANHRYTVSMWLRGTSTNYVLISVRQDGPPYANYLTKLVKLSPAWTQVQFDGVTNPADAALIVKMETPGSVWLDDVAVDEAAVSTTLPAPPATVIPRNYFGLHFNRLDTPWPNVGTAIGAVRIWDAGDRRDGTGVGAQWSEINPADGVYDWSGLDARVASAQARNAEVLYTLGGRTPQWASGQPDIDSPYGPGQCGAPASDAIWQKWVRTIAERYRGRIRHWEIWNEPDLRGFYCDSPARLVQLAQLAYTVLKQVDPGNQVVAPGFSGYEGTAWFDFFLAAGGGQYVDILNHHFYVETPEDVGGYFGQNVRNTVARYGQTAKPLWNTEQGWVEFPLVNPLPATTGAALVARSYLLNWAFNLRRYFYYTWDNANNLFPFVTSDGVTLTAAGRAYREVAGWMTGKTMEGLSQTADGIWIVTLRDTLGARQRALWRPAGNSMFELPSAWGITRQRNLDGVESSVSSPSLSIGPAPLLLSGTDAGAIIVDNAPRGIQDPSGGRTFGGEWCVSMAKNPYNGNSLFSCGKGTDTYRWTPKITTQGRYEVYVRWTQASTRSFNVPYRVVYGGGTTLKTFNQRINGGQWIRHGIYSFSTGTRGYVEVSDSNGQASADAIRLVPVP